MALFETTLVLVLIAVLLSGASGRLGMPYPTILALGGALIASLPWSPEIAIDARLALVLFIAPALLDAAFDLPPRELKRNWLPLVSLALVAVVLTTAAVAWVGWAAGGLSLAAAVALGAIVAPTDAAAATAVLERYEIPHRTFTILQGESLLNDAVALMIFSAAVDLGSSAHPSLGGLVPRLLVAAPGGVLVGIVLGRAFVAFAPRVVGTLGGRIFEWIATFGTWVIADRLHLSAILAVVACAMTIAHTVPARTPPRARVQSYAVWEVAVFGLNVLAFLLTGLQAKHVIVRLAGDGLWPSLGFAALVLVVVIAVRVAWVMTYGFVRRRLPQQVRGKDLGPIPTVRVGLLVSWCGMRGLVTLATALALPDDLPGRDLVLLSAFAVVLGTLVVQGLTLNPLLRVLKIPPDRSLEAEVSRARTEVVDAALAQLAGVDGDAASAVRAEYEAAREAARDEEDPLKRTEYDRLRLDALKAARGRLNTLRSEATISDDAYHQLEEELDWAEIAATPTHYREIEEA